MGKQILIGQSFYEVLGLEQDASIEDIVEAYQSKKEELDSLSEVDEEIVQKATTLLERAYGTLRDEERRAEYDVTLEESEADPNYIPGTALREFDTLTIYPDPQQEVVEEGEEVEEVPAKKQAAHPRLSGRLKATVTVPLSTITRAIQEGGDLTFLDTDEPVPRATQGNKQGVLIDRNQIEEQVNSYGAITQTLETNRLMQATKSQQEGTSRERRQSLELPRTAVSRLTRDPDEPRKGAFDYFLIFCAFILPVATVLLTLIHFLLPKS